MGEPIVLGNVFRDANPFGFSFLAPLNMDKKKISKGNVVAVSNGNGCRIVAVIDSVVKAQDDYFCECKTAFCTKLDGKIVNERLYPLLCTPVLKVDVCEIKEEI